MQKKEILFYQIFCTGVQCLKDIHYTQCVVQIAGVNILAFNLIFIREKVFPKVTTGEEFLAAEGSWQISQKGRIRVR